MREAIGKRGPDLNTFCEGVKLPLGKLQLTEICNIKATDYKVNKAKQKTLLLNENRHIKFGKHTLKFEKVVQESAAVRRIYHGNELIPF